LWKKKYKIEQIQEKSLCKKSVPTVTGSRDVKILFFFSQQFHAKGWRVFLSALFH